MVIWLWIQGFFALYRSQGCKSRPDLFRAKHLTGWPNL